MFPVKRLLLLLPLVGLLSSCSEDFEVAAPYEHITVVYGLMDMRDTAHYIRIQKAFLDEHKSAIDMAKEEDSSYYDPAILSVHLKDFEGGALQFDETLGRVDLNTENFPKDSGFFYGPRNAHNWAYKSTRPLIPGHIYRLVVHNLATGQVDSAETPIIDYTRSVPNGLIAQELDPFFFNTISFPALLANHTYAINIVQAPANAQLYEGVVRFHYVDKNASGGERRDSADFHFGTTTSAARAVVLSVPQRSFYYFLKERLGPAPANIQRLMDSVTLQVWAGSADMAVYQRINGAQGGITADQIKPLFTNIKSNNRGSRAIGLFTTRTHAERRNIGIDQLTLDSLIRSPITAELNITGRTTN
jgi:hypothetical protein